MLSGQVVNGIKVSLDYKFFDSTDSSIQFKNKKLI